MLSKPRSPPVLITDERFTRSENDVPFHRRINPFCCATNILVLQFAGLVFGGIAISIGSVRPASTIV